MGTLWRFAKQLEKVVEKKYNNLNSHFDVQSLTAFTKRVQVTNT